MAYATFADYKTWLHGRAETIPSTEFDYWEYQARTKVDKVTYDRLHEEETYEKFKDNVIGAVCAIAEILYKSEDQSSKRTSWKIGSFSENFTETNTLEIDNSVKTASYDNLSSTGLLYRGG